MDELTVRSEIYFAAVCRCFPGKTSVGGDRVPAPEEIRNCSSWLNQELKILQPDLVIPVGRLAIAQFIALDTLDQVIGRKFVINRADGLMFEAIPLPHPSGASPWHKLSPGRELTARAMRKIARHPAMLAFRRLAASRLVVSRDRNYGLVRRQSLSSRPKRGTSHRAMDQTDYSASSTLRG